GADSPGAPHWFGAACGDTVKGDCGCLQTAGHRAMGSPARPLCGPVGELFGPPRRAIYRTCAQRHRTEKLPEKSQQGLDKGLAATQSRVTWSNPRSSLEDFEPDLGVVYPTTADNYFAPKTG